MSEPRVRWGVSITLDCGKTRRRGHSSGVRAWSSRQEALSCAAKFSDDCDARIVKLTSAKVIKRVVKTWAKGTNVRRLLAEAALEAIGATTSCERVMRITFEELAP
jgi:hypothetical protein